MHERYNSWIMSVYFVLSVCDDIYGHYVSTFTNELNRNKKIKTVQQMVDRINGKTKPNPKNDFEDINIALDKLEEIIYRLEEKENLQLRQKIAQHEHDSSLRYWLRYDGNSWKAVPKWQYINCYN